jgi:hypothetical protein
VPARQIPELPARRLVDPDRQELLELLAPRVQDPERRIARPGQLAPGLQHALEHQLEIEVADQAASQLQQSLQPLLAEAHGPILPREGGGAGFPSSAAAGRSRDRPSRLAATPGRGSVGA